MQLPTMRPLFLVPALVAGALAAASCSTSKSSPATPSPAASGATLSTQFTTTCAPGCHGSDGASIPAGSNLAALKGNTTYTEAKWQTAIRSGISGTGMAAWTTSTYSDANMQADYKVLTGLTW